MLAFCFRNVNEATAKIRGAIAQVFSTVASGQSQVSVSLSRIRTIKVTIIGVSNQVIILFPFVTVYNALFLGEVLQLMGVIEILNC
jgi:hypothetical protein